MNRLRFRFVLFSAAIAAASLVPTASGAPNASPPERTPVLAPRPPDPASAPAFPFARQRAEQTAERAKAASQQAAQAAKKATAATQAVAKAKSAQATAANTVAEARKSVAEAKAALAQAQQTLAKTQTGLATAQANQTSADQLLAQATQAANPLAEANTIAAKAAADASSRAARAAARLAVFEKTFVVADPLATHEVASFKADRPLYSCRVDPTGRYVFAGAQGRAIHRWDLLSGDHLELAGHHSWIRRIAVSADGRQLVSGDYAGHLIWWNAADAKPAALRDIKAHSGYARGVAISPDGRFVASGGNDNMVRIWSAADGSLVAELAGHESQVYNLAFHPSGQALVSGDLMGVLKQWEVGTWKHVRDFDAGVLEKYDETFVATIGGVRGMDISPDGQYLAAAGIIEVSNAFAGVGKPAVVLFDWKTGQQVNILKPAAAFQGTCWSVRFHPSGRFLVGAGGGSSGALWFWKPDNEKAFHSVNLPSVAYACDFHPGGLRLAVALYDKTLRIYDLGPKIDVAKVK